MILGSDAIIVDYAEARFLVEALQGPVMQGTILDSDQLSAFENLQRAVREIESRKFGDPE